jgi:hypothetical protein
MWFGGTTMASSIQEWEDFPGGETKAFVSGKTYSNYNTVRTVLIICFVNEIHGFFSTFEGILGEIGIKVDEAEGALDLTKNADEKIKDTELISEPQPQIQRQKEYEASEEAYMVS